MDNRDLHCAHIHKLVELFLRFNRISSRSGREIIACESGEHVEAGDPHYRCGILADRYVLLLITHAAHILLLVPKHSCEPSVQMPIAYPSLSKRIERTLICLRLHPSRWMLFPASVMTASPIISLHNWPRSYNSARSFLNESDDDLCRVVQQSNRSVPTPMSSSFLCMSHRMVAICLRRRAELEHLCHH